MAMLTCRLSERSIQTLVHRCVVALCAACSTDISNLIRVEPAPTPGAVVFVLEDRSLVYGLTVMTCRGRAMWTISNGQLGGAPRRITYGVTPNGFVSRTGPGPLSPGCYEVIVSGPSRTRFHIGTDGQLVASADSSRRTGRP
jgi:hypothetical protein